MGRLADKIAIITGGAAGIGLATARAFIAEGARVLLVDVQAAPLAAAVAELGDAHARACVADVSDPVQVETYVAAALEHYGRIDIFFNNAGIEGVVSPLVDYPLEMFDRVMAVNVRGVWLGMKSVIPAMAKTGGGSIIITSSLGGLRGVPRMSAYIAAKHAVVGIMRAAALECAPLNIRVNTINPSPIATRMIAAIEEGYAPGVTARAKARFAAGVPLRRYGEPEEVAKLVVYLASDESSYSTGGTFTIDGGMSAA